MTNSASELSMVLTKIGERSCFLNSSGDEVNLIDVNQVDWSGDTPLIIATISGDIDSVRVLIESGAHVNFQGEEGKTALHYATTKNRLDIAALLVSKGCDKNIADARGKRPIDIARQLNNADIVHLLSPE